MQCFNDSNKYFNININIQSTPDNSNPPLTRSNFHILSDHFLYNFTLDNSNSR